MRFSNIKSVVLAVAAAQAVSAHTRFTNFFVDGVNQGDGTCVRMSNINSQATNPVHGITGNDMACGTFYLSPIALLHSLHSFGQLSKPSCHALGNANGM